VRASNGAQCALSWGGSRQMALRGRPVAASRAGKAAAPGEGGLQGVRRGAALVGGGGAQRGSRENPWRGAPAQGGVNYEGGAKWRGLGDALNGRPARGRYKEYREAAPA
jgi:hypothetical protein